MAISKQEFSGHIRSFNFRALFNVMGWDNDRGSHPITIDDQTFILDRVAEKRGFKILVCPPVNGSTEALIPDYNTRKRIENKITRLFQEHLIIFIDNRKHEQIWQLVVRQTGKPTKVTETRYALTQDPELLYQRASGLFFSLDEEENITIVDVTQRVDANFHQNADRVTKRFYERFKREHSSFLAFIEGIDERLNKEWYASLMLNRLMFCYFIQKKGFLDNNRNYLRDRLNACRERRGQDQFYSFYRDFLLVLFHEGLNSINHSSELRQEIGRIPYLNGGLFDEHEIEQNHHIDIKDQAFEDLFDFFDQYEWHLDTRFNATGREVNPDVIGYIFEKYINDRAQMGAYYTKEDITEYISKNTVLPWLFDETKRDYPKAFELDGEIWQWVQNSGDDYIYDAVKYGIPEEGGLFDDLPDEMKAGFRPDLEQVIVKAEDSPHLWEIRKLWNQKAPAEIALPTEIFREVIERQKRYADVKGKIENGEISQINDFITYNLNIRQFAQDVIENTTDPDFLRHFYKAINKVTILDPTCGSGAFLFAAMNILEPLYEACLMRMRAFVEEEDRLNETEKRAFKNQYKFFRQVLAETQNEHHPNLQYFIYKSIILQNLYGVDIMKEAVEIAKLRLFLKLVATVETDYRKPNLGLEPLPDIDFNIRAGNTLVGFATEKELEKALTESLDGAFAKAEIEEKCDIVARTFTRYKEIQLSIGDNYHDFKAAKEELNKRLKELNHELNLLLHKQASKYKFDDWLTSHQPFHWFAEFYEIIHDRGGFDVIIGNPPYVPLSDVNYSTIGYTTTNCGDIYALCVERVLRNLLSKESKFGMIVPISIVSTDGYSTLRSICSSSNFGFYFANFGVRPSKLFDGVDKRLSIFITANSSAKNIFTSKYYRWVSEERDVLFKKLSYQLVEENILNISGYPKISTILEQKLLYKLSRINRSISHYKTNSSDYKVRFTRKLQYFIQFFENPPLIYDENRNILQPSELKEMGFSSFDEKIAALSSLNSNLFFWFFITFSDCRNVNFREILSFPIDNDLIDERIFKGLSNLSSNLMENLQQNAIFQIRNDKRAGIIEIQSYQPRLSKIVIDEIDQVLSELYGFTEEELDFIINYDIKYRMGKELEDGDKEE